ncbi:MAG: hypothetical protein HZB29_03425 [Nitrospinae bacterium]|nr:hypothetical protein [Nitrospinota bacterium]
MRAMLAEDKPERNIAIPTLVITELTDHDIREELARSGTYCLFKPVRPVEFIDMICKLESVAKERHLKMKALHNCFYDAILYYQ